MLCAEVPLILRRDVYATAAIAGAAVFVLLRELGATGAALALVPIAVVFGLRLVAIRLDLNFPRFTPKDDASRDAGD